MPVTSAVHEFQPLGKNLPIVECALRLLVPSLIALVVSRLILMSLPFDFAAPKAVTLPVRELPKQHVQYAVKEQENREEQYTAPVTQTIKAPHLERIFRHKGAAVCFASRLFSLSDLL